MNNIKLAIIGFLILFSVPVLALAILGDHIFGSSFATNPAEVLTEDSNYSQLQAASAPMFSCPDNFDLNTLGNVCDYNGTKIMGWVGVDFTADDNSVSDIQRIKLKLSELNLGCTDCNRAVTVHVFYTADLADGNTTNWVYVGACSANNNQQNVLCTKTLGGVSVEGVIVGRNINSTSWPDPALHWVKIDDTVITPDG